MWKIDYLKEDNIMFVKPSGPLTLTECKQLCEETYSAGRSNNSHKFLIDCRNMGIKLSVLEIDKIPDMIKTIGANPEDRAAILFNMSSPQMELLNFLRNSLYLKSIKMRIFPEPDKAIAWLKYEEADAGKSSN
jgi:hypothetical protein